MERPVLAVAIRRCLIAFAALLLPAAAAGQIMDLQDDPAWGGVRLRVTPFAGWATSVNRDEEWRLTYNDGTSARYDARIDLAGGPMVGLNLEYALRGPWSVIAGGAFLSRDDATFLIASEDRTRIFTSSSSLFARLGASLQLHEELTDLVLRRLGASVYAAPFIQLEMPDEIIDPRYANTGLFDNATHFGLNLGATGELPFATDRMALQLGFEDFLTLWSENALARLPRYLGNDPNSATRLVDASSSVGLTHQWVVRAGLSFRF